LRHQLFSFFPGRPSSFRPLRGFSPFVFSCYFITSCVAAFSADLFEHRRGFALLWIAEVDFLQILFFLSLNHRVIGVFFADSFFFPFPIGWAVPPFWFFLSTFPPMKGEEGKLFRNFWFSSVGLFGVHRGFSFADRGFSNPTFPVRARASRHPLMSPFPSNAGGHPFFPICRERSFFLLPKPLSLTLPVHSPPPSPAP